jgi:hypothetical protein
MVIQLARQALFQEQVLARVVPVVALVAVVGMGLVAIMLLFLVVQVALHSQEVAAPELVVMVLLTLLVLGERAVALALHLSTLQA